MARRIVRQVVLLVSAFLVVSISGLRTPMATTQAQVRSLEARSPALRSFTADLAVDCVKTMRSPEGHAYAVQHKLCSQSGISPQGTVQGNCGSARLLLYGIGNSTVRFNQYVVSFQGPMIHLYDKVNWQNISRSYAGSFTNTQFGLSSTWYKDDYVNTGTGTIWGTMIQLNVDLASGLSCYGLMPSDQTIAF